RWAWSADAATAGDRHCRWRILGNAVLPDRRAGSILLAGATATRRRITGFEMRLLVVEDEQTLARYLRRGLEEATMTVDLAASVDAAWRMLTLNPYDAVVLDLGLPGANGSELL